MENVYAALAVLLGYTNIFKRTNQWQNQARYEVDEGEICGFHQIIESEGVVQLVLYHARGISAESSQLFQALVEKFLSGRKITVRRFPILRCGNCGYAQQRAELKKRINAEQPFIHCPDCGERNKLPSPHDLLLLGADISPRVQAEQVVASLRTRFEAALVQVKALGLQDREQGPSCFVSYAWGDQAHQDWVKERLAKDLQNAGIQVVLDEWSSVAIGTDISRFISDYIPTCDAVIVVGTPMYMHKFENQLKDEGTNVAFEMDLIHQRLKGTARRRSSVYPVLLDGTPQSSLPPLLQSRAYGDFRNDQDYLPNLLDLILAVYGIPIGNPAITEMREALRGRPTMV